MHYTYVLRSVNHPGQSYIGSTANLRQRLADHNSGKSIHTNKFRPWQIAVYVAFSRQEQAERFERYLKSGSGRAFLKKHLWGR